MESQQVDSKLLAMLKDLPYFSRLGTCISIRLADYAAQLCGCRSTRQVDDSKVDEVSDQFDVLINELQYKVDECIEYISAPHIYKTDIFEMDDTSIECLLEDALYDMIQHDNKYLFVDHFFIDE